MSNEVVVVGDVHGDLNQLIYPLLYFMKNKCKKIIYLGDYIDRGESTVYIYEIIRGILECREMKDKIIFLRGNHETYDGSVYDYMSTNTDVLNTTKSYIKSFMFGKFNKLGLNVSYYDEESNILYSHSPLNRNLKGLVGNNNDELTFTDDKERVSMTYRNIHGHDHKISSLEDIDKFMRGEKKMISLDGDASYGICVLKNAYKRTDRWTELVKSSVKYLVMCEDGGEHEHEPHTDTDNYNGGRNIIVESSSMVVGKNYKWRLESKVIDFQSEYDMNTKLFRDVKQILIDGCKNFDNNLLRCFKMLNLNESLNTFKSEYLKIFKDDREFKRVLINLRELYESNLKRKSGVNVYFNDVPLEIYQQFDLFNPMEYMPIHRLYWYKVLGNFIFSGGGSGDENGENGENGDENTNEYNEVEKHINHRYKVMTEMDKVKINYNKLIKMLLIVTCVVLVFVIVLVCHQIMFSKSISKMNFNSIFGKVIV